MEARGPREAADPYLKRYLQSIDDLLKRPSEEVDDGR